VRHLNLISGIWITYLRRSFWRFRFDSVPAYIDTEKDHLHMDVGTRSWVFLILFDTVAGRWCVPDSAFRVFAVFKGNHWRKSRYYHLSARSKKKETGQKRTIFQAVRSFRYSDDILKIGFVPSNWLVHSSTEFVYSPYLKSISLWRKRNNRKWQVVVLVTRVTQYALSTRNQVELADSWRVNLK
jgi:hypothetical protein